MNTGRQVRQRVIVATRRTGLAALMAAIGAMVSTSHAQRGSPPPSSSTAPRAASDRIVVTMADGGVVTATIEPRSVERRSFRVLAAACGSCVGEHMSLEFRATAQNAPFTALRVALDVVNPTATNRTGPAQTFRSGDRYPGALRIEIEHTTGPPTEVPGIVELDRAVAERDGRLQITFRPIPGTNPPFRTFVASLALPPIVARGTLSD